MTDPIGEVGSTTAPPGRPPVWLLYLVTVTGVLGNTLVGPVLPSIVDDLGVSRSLAGFVITAATVPGIVMAPVVGLLADRHGRRRVLVPCLALFGAGGVTAGLMPSFWSLLGARVVQGMGAAGLINLAVVLIGDHWEGTDRARLIGRNAAVLTVTVSLAPLAGGLLAEAGSWRWAFAPYLAGLVVALLVHRVLPRDTGTGATGSLVGQLRQAAPVLGSRPVAPAIAIGSVVFVLVFGLFLTIVPLHLSQNFGLGPRGIGLVMGVPALCSAMVAFNAGRLRERAAIRTLVMCGLVVFALAFSAMTQVHVLWPLVAGAALYGFGEGLVIPSLQDLVTGSAPAATRGSVVAVWVSGVRTGQAVGPALAGVALATVGAGGAFAFGAAVALVLVVVAGRALDA